MAGDEVSKEPIRVAGYCRVSTEEQAQGGVSIEAQRQYIQEWCAREGWKLRAIYKDPGHSGKDLDRPGIKLLLEDAKVGWDPVRKVRDPSKSLFDMVVAYSNDRLSRDAKDTLEIRDMLERMGVQLRFGQISNIDLATAEGRYLLTNLAATAEFYRRDIAQKTKRSMVLLKEKGHHVGRPPWGFRIGDKGVLEVADRRVEAIWKMYYQPPHHPISRIAQQLGLSPRKVSTVVHLYPKVQAAWAAAGLIPASRVSSSLSTPSGRGPREMPK